MNRYLGKDANRVPRAEVSCPCCKQNQIKTGWNMQECSFVCENCGVVFVPIAKLWKKEE